MTEVESQQVEPIPYSEDVDSASERLVAILTKMDGFKSVTAESNYVHAVFISRIFRFADDVEFLFDDDQKIIHVRSASRVGYYDIGVNRKRIVAISNQFADGNR